ncbi:aldo/keto reductase [Cognatishimia activa]|uniref:L-glyceraldehyde 3-phosphate reductase n=1 Tax=Cognatishimia activa TaxID=1715691 RepID=A0A0P1J6Z9_9RHOB|nr:aldo/keto reductase [Cognatishimia activa]CUI87445.1 L-glyceraldehyde 3-phosphate reductase [Cognatishimia activa]CUK25613.1 L-glyceraldehyde 3-phosphate reductase [Cognatishimia activa]
MRAPITSPNGTPVSRFTFGTMQFGERADAKASREMFDACVAAGINHFDTAYVYTEGASETLLGEFAAPMRDDLVIATKAAYSGGSGRANILQAFDTSRQRLNMDYVDILYLHRFDPAMPLEETYDTLAELKAQGKIGHIGVSNHAAWQVMKSVTVAAERDLTIDILQPMYNLVKRQVEVELLPMAKDQGILVAPYSPLAAGLLTGKYSGIEDTTTDGRLTEDSRYHARYGQEWMWQTARDLKALAEDHGVAPATLAVAWIAKHVDGLSPILSARSAEQLAPSLAAISFEMDDALYQEITALSPTPAPATDRLEEA